VPVGERPPCVSDRHGPFHHPDVGQSRLLWSSTVAIHRIVGEMRYLYVVACVLGVVACESQHHAQECSPPCTERQSCVDGICRDRTCQPPCPTGRVCVNGFCLRECDPESGAGCSLSETCCAHIRACIDTDTDYFHCGGCGDACPVDRSNTCASGRCGCEGYSANPCVEGSGCCSDGCRDLMNDVENCGECGHSCGGLQCTEGQCLCSTEERCPEGEECCTGGCRDLSSDPESCGSCDHACESGQECCDGQCVNTFTDVGHCGRCGNACSEGWTCCLGTCTDIRTDRYNCGECLHDCGSGSQCVDGSCQ
jgi:hypothetical protein